MIDATTQRAMRLYDGIVASRARGDVRRERAAYEKLRALSERHGLDVDYVIEKLSQTSALPGHSPEVVRENVRRLSTSMPHANACGVAVRRAREWWSFENPGTELPPHLRRRADENLAVGSYDVVEAGRDVPLHRVRSAESAHRAARSAKLIDAPVDVYNAAAATSGGPTIRATISGSIVAFQPVGYLGRGDPFRRYVEAARPARYDRGANAQIAPIAHAKTVVENLEKAGFTVDASPDARAAIERAATATTATEVVEEESSLGSISVEPAKTRRGERGAAFRPTTRLPQRSSFDRYREIMKDGGAIWDGGQSNVAPIEIAPKIVKALSDAGFVVVVDPSLAGAMEERVERAKEDISAGRARARKLDAELRKRGLSLYDYQKEGIAWLSGKQTAMLFDDQGLGKTLQTLSSLPPDAPVVVVAPASVKGEWAKEARKWRPEYRATVLDTKGNEPFRWPSPNEIVITNYSNLPDEGEYGPPPEGTVLVADEAQELKSDGGAAKGRRFEAMAKSVRARGGRTWGLSGTPLENEEFELWNLLQIFGVGEEAFGTKSGFARLMGGELVEGYGRQPTHWEFPNPPDTPAIVERLHKVSLRRDKKFALKHLPPKTYEHVHVELSVEDREALDRELREAGIDVEAIVAAIEQSAADADELPEFRDLARAREILARAKIPKLLEIVKEYEDRGEPIVVFSAHKAPIKALSSRSGWAEMSGDVSTKKRPQIIDDFQEGRLRGIAATIRASGTGITLTRANTAIFLDQDWTPTKNLQATDRIHRIGQTRDTFIFILVADHAIDARIAEILERKRRLIDATVNATARGHLTEGEIQPEQIEVDFDALAAEARAEVEERRQREADVERVREIEGERRRVASITRPARNEVEQFSAEAVVKLAAMDQDFAAIENMMGFSKSDGKAGHWIANQFRAEGQLTDKQWSIAKKLALRYKRQVGDAPVETKGRWFVDPESGELIRAVTVGDVMNSDVDVDAPEATVNGRRYLIVDGWTYSAKREAG